MRDLQGRGEVYRRDKDRELLCGCSYDLDEGDQEILSVGRGQHIAGFGGDISGTLMPSSPMTVRTLMGHADKSGLLQLRLDNDQWLDFILKPDGSIVGSGGLRDER